MNARSAAGLAATALLCALLTWLAARLTLAPPALAASWLACGVGVGAALRWPVSRALPAVGVALLAGAAAGGETGAVPLASGAVTLAEVAAIAGSLRRRLPQWDGDARPPYRVRLARLVGFVFGITLPASLVGGALVGALHAAAGEPPAAALHAAQLHAAANGLSVVVLAPLMWWQRLRTTPWPLAAAVAASAAAVPAMAADHGALFWLAPAIVIVAGYIGSTWTAMLAVACMAASLLAVGVSGAVPAIDGPHGFVVWLLVVWRLATAGLIASLWSEQRAGTPRHGGRAGAAHATPAAACADWRTRPRAAGRYGLLWLDEVAALGAPPPGLALAAGSSLQMRSALKQLAACSRAGDEVVGIGARGALLLLRQAGGATADPQALAGRHRRALHGGLRLRAAGTVPAEVARFLLVSAAYLGAALPDAGG